MFTVQPAVVEAMVVPPVSTRIVTCRDSALEDPWGPTASNATMAMLTTPLGKTKLEPLKPEMVVAPVLKLEGFVIGAELNSAVVPPITEAIVTTMGS